MSNEIDSSALEDELNDNYAVASSLYKQGLFDRAINLYEECISKYIYLEKGSDSAYVASTYNNIAAAYSIKGDYEKALQYHEKSLQIKIKKYEDSHPEIADSYNNIAIVYYNQADYVRALSNYNKSLIIYTSKFGKDHPKVADTYYNIAIVYYNRNNFDTALSYYDKAVQIRQRELGSDHLQ